MKINLTCLTFWANTGMNIKKKGAHGAWPTESDGKCQKNI